MKRDTSTEEQNLVKEKRVGVGRTEKQPAGT